MVLPPVQSIAQDSSRHVFSEAEQSHHLSYVVHEHIHLMMCSPDTTRLPKLYVCS